MRPPTAASNTTAPGASYPQSTPPHHLTPLPPHRSGSPPPPPPDPPPRQRRVAPRPPVRMPPPGPQPRLHLPTHLVEITPRLGCAPHQQPRPPVHPHRQNHVLKRILQIQRGGLIHDNPPQAGAHPAQRINRIPRMPRPDIQRPVPRYRAGHLLLVQLP